MARRLQHGAAGVGRTDWSRFDALPLFKLVNRMNAYNTDLLMERQAPR